MPAGAECTSWAPPARPSEGNDCSLRKYGMATPTTNPDTVTESILIPLPDHDFDPTECAIPWEVCISRGMEGHV